MFFYLKYIFAVLSGLFMLWLSCTLFIRSCGGPFPHRTRAPFAKKEYIQLGELPAWEDVLTMSGLNKTTSEMLMEGEGVPPLKFDVPSLLGPATPENPTK